MTREQNGNGNNNVADLTLRMIKGLRTQMLGMRADILQIRRDMETKMATKADLAKLAEELRAESKSDLAAFRAEVRQQFDRVDERFEVLTRAIKGIHRTHGKRIRALEVHTGLRAR